MQTGQRREHSSLSVVKRSGTHSESLAERFATFLLFLFQSQVLKSEQLEQQIILHDPKHQRAWLIAEIKQRSAYQATLCISLSGVRVSLQYDMPIFGQKPQVFRAKPRYAVLNMTKKHNLGYKNPSSFLQHTVKSCPGW